MRGNAARDVPSVCNLPNVCSTNAEDPNPSVMYASNGGLWLATPFSEAFSRLDALHSRGDANERVEHRPDVLRRVDSFVWKRGYERQPSLQQIRSSCSRRQPSRRRSAVVLVVISARVLLNRELASLLVRRCPVETNPKLSSNS